MNILGHNVGVDFRGFDIGMPHQFLDDPDIDAVFKQMRGKGMPEGVATCLFVDACASHGRFHCLLQPDSST